MAIVYYSGPGLGVVQFHVRFLGYVGLYGMANSGIPIGAVMSSAAVAVVVGAVELWWSGNMRSVSGYGFISRKRAAPQLHLVEEMCG